jgi:hypothetical protein
MRFVIFVRYAFAELILTLWRASILSAEINILNFFLKVVIFISSNFHSMIFLIVSSIVSLLEIFSWIEIQW